MKFRPNPEHKVFVAGHRGMVGSAIVRALKAKGGVRKGGRGGGRGGGNKGGGGGRGRKGFS